MVASESINYGIKTLHVLERLWILNQVKVCEPDYRRPGCCESTVQLRDSISFSLSREGKKGQKFSKTWHPLLFSRFCSIIIYLFNLVFYEWFCFGKCLKTFFPQILLKRKLRFFLLSRNSKYFAEFESQAKICQWSPSPNNMLIRGDEAK